jgi:hypothetical protein
VLREIAELFVDDGLLAILVLGRVAAAAIASPLSGLWGGCVLFGGCLVALSVTVTGTVLTTSNSNQRRLKRHRHLRYQQRSRATQLLRRACQVPSDTKCWPARWNISHRDHRVSS